MPDDTKPSLYLLRGDDSAKIKEILAGFQAGLGDEGMGDLNTSRLDGETLGFEALQADALTIPFLADRRLIIVDNARQMLAKVNKDSQEKYLDLFSSLPPSTALVLLVEDEISKKWGERDWVNLKSYSWLTQWIEKEREKALIVNCSLPDQSDMRAWILRRAKEQGGGFQPEAAQLLASYIGNDTLQAAQEIDKLLTYVGPARIVAPEDVELLTAHAQEGNLFGFTDALGERDGIKAMREFQLLTEKNDVMELTGMIHRQFRLLIQAREILDEGGGIQQIEKELKIAGFIAKKLYSQAQRFGMKNLLSIYQRLLEIDEGIKTGGMPGQTAFELLIADLTAK